MSGGPGDFLSRWSRRKRDIGRSEETPRPDLNGDPVPDVPPALPEDELRPEEIDALPKVEEITPETDMAVFLRKGVPELLRKAALRRLWSVDPAIRDYVGDARDYAYDWNVPGGVPGNGPLLPTDDVAAMLDRLFGGGPGTRPEKQPSPVREPGQAESQSGEPEYEDRAGPPSRDERPNDDAAQNSDDPPSSDGPAGIAENMGDVRGDPAPGRDAAPPMSGVSDRAQPPRRRRHGGATPG